MRSLLPGDKIKLTGVFLKNSGQRKGGEGSTVWTVKDCHCPLCTIGAFVCTDAKLTGDWFTPEEIAKEPWIVFRHFDAQNVYRVGTLDSRNTP